MNLFKFKYFHTSKLQNKTIKYQRNVGSNSSLTSQPVRNLMKIRHCHSSLTTNHRRLHIIRWFYLLIRVFCFNSLPSQLKDTHTLRRRTNTHTHTTSGVCKGRVMSLIRNSQSSSAGEFSRVYSKNEFNQ